MKGLLLGFVVSFSMASHAQIWLPEEEVPSDIIQHLAITIGYSEYHELPRWVAYSLRKEQLQDCASRSNNFRVDPTVRTGSASPEDYQSSGYDRGHIAPAGDMKWSAQAMKESFYMSNITPQTPGMNRGRWANLELLARAWAKEGDETIIVSGPVLSDDLERIGETGVSVPVEHYKVLLRTQAGRRSAIAFLMTQNPHSEDLRTYALPVSKIEERTGLNFFPHLTKTEQHRIERVVDWTQWNFKAKFSYYACSK